MAAPKVQSSPRLQPFSPLSLAEREAACAVLEDCVDQLAVLGAIMPNYAEKPSAADRVLGDELVEILRTQRHLENQFERLVGGGEGRGGNLREYAHSLASTAQVARHPKAVAENMAKLQEDREFLQSLVSATLEEVGSGGTFCTLSQQLEQCHQKKLAMEETILREEESRRRVRELRKQLVDLRRAREEENNSLDEQIAHLKDQLQELKAKTSLEGKYTKKESQVGVEVALRHQSEVEEGLTREEGRLRQQLEEEKKVNERIATYLQKHYEELAGQVDHWMARYDEDLEMKTKELHDIKQAKASGLQRLDELTKQYKQYEEVVVEHRAMKEKQRLKAEQEERERRAAVKLQAWWRGLMVRKCLGPFAKKKKGKGKGKKGKGKKGKKGKKKK